MIVSRGPAAAAIADRQVWLRDGRVVEEQHAGRDRTLVATRGWIRLPGAPSESVAVTAADAAELLAAAADGRVTGTHARSPAAPAAAVAELAAVGKRYGSRVVLDDVTAAFAPGRLTAVVGRSGSGKTTMLHLLAGLERPTSGSVTVAGTPLGTLTRTELAALRRRHVALVTQEPGLVPYLSALENVELGLALRDAPADGARDALCTVGLGERLDHPVDRLSAGERQRVAIARALAADVDLLLLDEPTARLDETNARSIAALFADVARGDRPIAVVCATHDPQLVELAAAVVDSVERDIRGDRDDESAARRVERLPHAVVPAISHVSIASIDGVTPRSPPLASMDDHFD